MQTAATDLLTQAILASTETAFWTKVYALAAIAQAVILVLTVIGIGYQLLHLRKTFVMAVYGSTYRSLAEINDIVLNNKDIAVEMNWGTSTNVFVWRLVSHLEFIFNLKNAGFISDDDWEGELEFVKDCCRRKAFQDTWRQGSRQFNRAFRTFLDAEIEKARQSS